MTIPTGRTIRIKRPSCSSGIPIELLQHPLLIPLSTANFTLLGIEPLKRFIWACDSLYDNKVTRIELFEVRDEVGGGSWGRTWVALMRPSVGLGLAGRRNGAGNG